MPIQERGEMVITPAVFPQTMYQAKDGPGLSGRFPTVDRQPIFGGERRSRDHRILLDKGFFLPARGPIYQRGGGFARR